MSRIVFLALADGEVDALSHLPGMDPRPEVVVVHPDSAALALQLASLSDLPTTTVSPSPRPDDVVVAGNGAGDAGAAWLTAFREAGARIVAADTFPAGMGTEGTDGGNGAAAAPPEETAPAEEAPDKAPVKKEARAEEPAPLERTVRERIMSDSEERKPPRRPELSLVRDQEPPSPDVWTDPETTFRYLLSYAAGPDVPATLWWDGGMEVWVPWVWTGSSPASEGKLVVRLPSAFGGFRLTGDWSQEVELPVAALTRVAEDMALRDLAVWDKTAAALAASRDVPRGRDALRRWAAPVLKALAPESAWLWERQPDGWKLRDAAGEDVSFSGDLVVSEHMLESLFQGPSLRWERWRPAEHLSVNLGFSLNDGQWPLRWVRVKKALTAKG